MYPPSRGTTAFGETVATPAIAALGRTTAAIAGCVGNGAAIDAMGGLRSALASVETPPTPPREWMDRLAYGQPAVALCPMCGRRLPGAAAAPAAPQTTRPPNVDELISEMTAAGDAAMAYRRTDAIHALAEAVTKLDAGIVDTVNSVDGPVPLWGCPDELDILQRAPCTACGTK